MDKSYGRIAESTFKAKKICVLNIKEAHGKGLLLEMGSGKTYLQCHSQYLCGSGWVLFVIILICWIKSGPLQRGRTLRTGLQAGKNIPVLILMICVHNYTDWAE